MKLSLYICNYFYKKYFKLNNKTQPIVTVGSRFTLQWICRKYGQKLGSDETTACFRDETHTKSSGPIVPGRRDPSLEDGNAPTSSRSRKSLSSVSGPPFSFCLSSLGGLCCYLFLSSVHPLPTLVSHPCLSSSARPLNHSFWHSVSCCGPHRPVQGSHPHQRGSGC